MILTFMNVQGMIRNKIALSRLIIPVPVFFENFREERR